MIPPRTWGVFAARLYDQAQRTGHQVYNRRAFEDACALDGMRRLEAQARLWASMFEHTPHQLAEWLADGRVSVYAMRRS